MASNDAGFWHRLNGYVSGSLFAVLLLVSCDSPALQAPSPEGSADAPVPRSHSAAATSPAAKLESRSEGAWINITGTIVARLPGALILRYGGGEVRVEMDDWDWYQEGQALRSGDRVAVTGRIDEELAGKRSIEARSVFVERLQTYFLASGADEESLQIDSLYRQRKPGHVEAIGRVIAVEGRELLLGPGAAPLRVDTSRIAENPFDRRGVQQIKIGDQVYVWGVIDRAMPSEPDFKALGVVKLHRDQEKYGLMGLPVAICPLQIDREQSTFEVV